MFDNRPLTIQEKNRFNEQYKRVIYHYENTTKQSFTKEEVVVLKLLVEITTPAVINSMITRFYKSYPKNFTSINYIYQPVKNMFSKKKRGVQNG